jgi:hypothetical protein
MPGFYDQGAIAQIAINLFYGWGYNFYRAENQLRADDQMVRSKASWLLGMARQSVADAESGYRRDFIPAPTREKPFPDAAVIANAQKLERMAGAIGAINSRLQSQPAPESDRLTQRYRNEAATLKNLIACDEQLVGQCSLMHTLVDGHDGAWLLEHHSEIEEGLAAIQQTMRNREAVLL